MIALILCVLTFDYKENIRGEYRKNYLLLKFAYDRVWRIARNHLRVMQHVEFLCRVTSTIQQDGLFTSGVVWQELEEVISHCTTQNSG